MKVVVIGGGYVGQLVQLEVPYAILLDSRPSAPQDHLDTRVGPQYLWEPIPGVQSTSFPVLTLVDGEPATPESILAYKIKIGKRDDGGNWGLQFRTHTVGWWADLPKPRVEYNQSIAMVDLPGKCLGMRDFTTINYDILVSTIPLPTLIQLLIVGPPSSKPFKNDPIWMITSHDHPKMMGMTLDYLTDPSVPWYRETCVGTTKYFESLTKQPGSVPIHPGKIHANPESEAIVQGLEDYDCYCFGRFATWRPDELAHETRRAIESWKNRMDL